MPRGPAPRAVTIPQAERRRVEEVAAAHSAPSAYRLRAKMILLLADGEGPSSVARRLGTSDRNVRKWRARWEEAPGLESLRDRDRPGAPPRFSLPERCELVKLACDRPDGIVTPFREEWSQESLAEVLHLTRGITMSRSTVQRILASNGLRPHRVRQWLHSPDPEFREKVERVCALYASPPENAVVLCVDEKPLQALERVHPTGRAPDGSVRREFEYVRHGVGALLAAFDIRTGHVLGRVVERRDAEALVSFLDEIAEAHRDRDVYIVWDNLNIHLDGREARWKRFNERHGGRFHFVHTPLHASWMNQVEIWFSILQRRVIRYGSFDSRERLAREVIAFVRFWNHNEAHPFRWKFSGDFDHDRRARAA
jgi:transposase